MNRKYKNIRVLKQVNISSSSDYFFVVRWDGGWRDYGLGMGFLHHNSIGDWTGAPQYLIDEVEQQICKMFHDGDAAFYEYDRDGNKRWEELRYRDIELEAIYASRYQDASKPSDPITDASDIPF